MPRALALAACAIATLLPFAIACGDGASDPADPNGGNATPVETADPRPSPRLDPPVSRFVVRVEDLGTNWITDISATLTVDASAYAKTSIFASEADGKKLLESWGYQGGYQTGYSPEGRDSAVLNGAYYVRTECHLFSLEAGARQAFAYFRNFAAAQPGMGAVIAAGVGNEHAAFVMTLGTIGKSSINAVYHQIIFRRGNLVCVVLTKGAEPFMRVDPAREIALISDKKALGQMAAPEPTPTSNYTPPAGN